MKWNAMRYDNRFMQSLTVPKNYGLEIQIRRLDDLFVVNVTDGYEWMNCNRYFDNIWDLMRYIRRLR